MDPINDQLAESGSLFQFDLDRNWSHGYDKLDLNGVDSGDYCEDRRRAVKMGDPMTLIFTSGTTVCILLCSLRLVVA
jgi:acyl-coenzyme A synthetase/AMP-(fatty) acid ligase